MALKGLHCADMQLRNCSLTHSVPFNVAIAMNLLFILGLGSKSPPLFRQ